MRASDNSPSHVWQDPLSFDEELLQPLANQDKGISISGCQECQQQQQQQQATTDDNHSGQASSCGSSHCEFSRLQLRLAAMESRLIDFEAILMGSRNRSIAGDCKSNWQGSRANNLMASSHMIHTGEPEGLVKAAALKEYQSSSKQPLVHQSKGDWSMADGSLNMAFSSESANESTADSSTNWTDPGSICKTANLNANQQARPASLTGSLAGNSQTLELVRYSTQDCADPYELASADSVGAANRSDLHAAAEALITTDGAGELRKREQQLKRLQSCKCQLMVTVLAEKSEPLPQPPTGRRSSRVVLESGSLRELAEPIDNDGGVGCGSKDGSRCSSWQLLIAQENISLHRPSRDELSMAEITETLVSNCPSETAAVSQMTQQQGGIAEFGTSAGVTAVEIIQCVQPPVSVRQLPVGCSIEEEVKKNVELKLLGSARQTWLLGGCHDDTTASTVSSTCTVSTGAEASAVKKEELYNYDCRLCTDHDPNARSRLKDLRRSGIQMSSTSRRVCVQKSGFTESNTARISKLVRKAVRKFDSDAEQASYVRLELRKLGFECTVVIGRHFIGCICGQESCRLLLDIGDRSCLIFSLFQLTRDLSQLTESQ